MLKPKKNENELDESKKVVWNAEKIKQVTEEIQKGYKPKHSPFFENKIYWRKADIAYEYSEWELEEIKRCATDINYFASKYCYLMTDNGYANIKLRDYQKEMLEDFQQNRFNVVLASRQIGKCVTYNTIVTIKEDNRIYDAYMGELYFKYKSKYVGLDGFEIIKFSLYSFLGKYERLIKSFNGFLRNLRINK